MNTLPHAVRSVRLLAPCLLFACLLFVVPLAQAQPWTDPSTMTDQQFFGVWSGTWTTVGKLNYAYAGGANWTAVETAVKAGNYTTAKANLLTYFKNRNKALDPNAVVGKDTALADLYVDNVICTDYYIGTLTIPQSATQTAQSLTSATYPNLTKAIQAQISSGIISFLLMGRNKEDVSGRLGQFVSREGATGLKPALTVVTTGGTYGPIIASEDTYIRQGAIDGGTNFGTATLLQVKDTGAPTSDLTRRTYIKFDLAAAGVPSTATVTSATLSLAGSNTTAGTGTMSVMLTKTAEQWVENVLTWNNVSQALTYSWQGVAGGYDWNDITQADSSWPQINSRMQFLNKIVLEYYNGGTRHDYPAYPYASAAIRWMLDIIDDKELATGDNTGVQGVWYTKLDTGIRPDVWVGVYEYLIDSAAMDAAANTAILKYLWREATALKDPAVFNTTGNWGVSESMGLFKVASFFPEFSDSGTWQTTAGTRFNFLLDTLFFADGSCYEATSGYGDGIIASYLELNRYVTLYGLTNPCTNYQTRMTAAARAEMDMFLPHGRDPNYGEADNRWKITNVKAVGDMFSLTDLQWWSSVPQNPDGSGYYPHTGTAPTDHKSAIYPDGRLMAMRSGWSANSNDLYLRTNISGAFNSDHAQAEDLTTTVYAYGKMLLQNPGRFSYTAGPILAWQSGTSSHNTVRVNDTHQRVYTHALSDGIVLGGVKGTFNDFVTNDAFDFFSGTTRNNNAGTVGYLHQRDILFVRPNSAAGQNGYWLVSDLVTGGVGTNNYQQDWHYPASANENTTFDASKKIKTGMSGTGAAGANIQIVPADPASITASRLDGYYSFDAGQVLNTKYVEYAKSVTGNAASFDTVLYPTSSPTDNTRNVTVTRLTLSPAPTGGAATASALQIDTDNGGGANHKGYYYLSHEAAPVTTRTFGGTPAFSFNGRLAYVETDNSGNLLSAMLRQGSALIRTSTSNNLITHTVPVEDIAVKWTSATVLDIYGASIEKDPAPSTADIAIYAPTATSVYCNGSQVTGFVRGGTGNNYIYGVRNKARTTVYTNNQGGTGVPFTDTSTIDVASFAKGSYANGKVVAEFDVTAALAGTVGVIGYTDTDQKAVAYWDDMGVQIRMNGTQFDARNGATYTFVNNIPQTTSKFHVKIVVDLYTQEYDAWVTPNGGSPTILAKDYAVRTPNNLPDGILHDLGRLVLKHTSATGSLKVENHTVRVAPVNDGFDDEGQQPDWQNNNVWQPLNPALWTNTVSNPGTDSVLVSRDFSTTDQAVEMIKTSTTGEVTMAKNLRRVSGTVTVDMMVRKTNNTKSLGIWLFDSAGNFTESIYFGNAGQITASVGAINQNVQAYSANTWYTVKLVLNTTTDTFDLYVDGVQKLTGAAVKTAGADLNELRITMQTDQNGTAYIDNVRVYK